MKHGSSLSGSYRNAQWIAISAQSSSTSTACRWPYTNRRRRKHWSGSQLMCPPFLSIHSCPAKRLSSVVKPE